MCSGDGKEPNVISISEDFFEDSTDIELKVRVLSKVDTTISGQYIGFCKVFDEQRKLYQNSIVAAKETYRLCIEMGYLADFMKKHEKEVIDMMSELFDEEFMREQYDREERKNEKINFALKLIARGKETLEEIAEDSGLTF